MQVHRFEHDPHAYAKPHGTIRSAPEQIGEKSQSTNVTRIDQSNTKTDAGSPLSVLTGQLSNVENVRSDVVAAAREKVAQGLFDTRESAEQLAASDLRHDYF
ncbi:MAG TPA: hypothetical protein VNQ76_02450 [Planctomicrobium sp.]|nr:hypothetical protein [Planctomicrobium sp.]